MINPSLDMLVKKVDNKYTLVVLAAKRAREIMSGSPIYVETKSSKPVTIALLELAANKITFERTKIGIK